MDKTIDLILSQLIFDIPSIVGISLLFAVFIIQIYFYITYYRKPITYVSQTDKKEEYQDKDIKSVSVIIIAKNESENLKKNLPAILNQNYPNFEVIVVNDGSTDESQNYLELLSKQDSRLYSTFLPISEDKEVERRRIICLTIGIKAAKNDILLFTDAGASPMTDKWIYSMVKPIDNQKEIVLGYSKLIAPTSFWEKICRFDNLIFSLQYFSMAIKNKPFIGTYTNIAYRKEIFFENKGFSKSLSFEYADEVFLNQIMSAHNTVVALDQESFVELHIENYSHWKTLKRIYYRSKKHFKGYTPKRFYLESFSRYLFYFFVLSLAIYSVIFNLWTCLIATLMMMLIRNIIQFKTLKKASIHFNINPLHVLLPFVELLQPLYLLTIGKNNSNNKILK